MAVSCRLCGSGSCEQVRFVAEDSPEIDCMLKLVSFEFVESGPCEVWKSGPEAKEDGARYIE